MSPDSHWVAWIAFGGGLVQTTAALIQVAQGRHGGTEDGRRTMSRGVGFEIRVGFVALLLELIAWPVLRLVDFTRYDHNPAHPKWMWPLVVSAPVLLLAATATVTSIHALLGDPLYPTFVEVWDGEGESGEPVMVRRKREQTMASVTSWLLASLTGIAVGITTLDLAGILDLNRLLGGT